MSPRFRCNTCLGSYHDTLPDGMDYYHACPPLAMPGAQPDPALPGFTPPVERERADKRDENLPPGIVFVEGLAVRLEPDPNDRAVVRRVPVTSLLKSEGKGRTKVS